MENGSMAEAYC